MKQWLISYAIYDYQHRVVFIGSFPTEANVISKKSISSLCDEALDDANRRTTIICNYPGAYANILSFSEFGEE